jgi:hypothetical protein
MRTRIPIAVGSRTAAALATVFASVLVAAGGAHSASNTPSEASVESLAAAAAAAPVTWSRTYGGAADGQGLHDLRLLPGGRLAVAGYSESFGGPGQFNWLMKLDLATGGVHTDRVSSSVMGGFTDGAALAADGGALFLGRDVIDIQLKHDAWVQRVDAAGHVEWSRGFTRPGTGRHFLFDAAELSDGSWIAVGATGELDVPPQSAWIVRLTATGDVIWQYQYGGGSVESARAVTPTLDGGFVVAGATNSAGAGGDDVWVMKIDALGQIKWQKTVGGFDADQAEDVVELADGSLVVVGSTNSLSASGHAPWILRFNGGGALLWHRVVDSDVWGDLGGVARTDDGNFVVVGRVGEPGFQSNDMWCAKFDAATGATFWQNAYEGDLGDFGSAVLPVSGPGIQPGYVVGGTWGWGFPGEAIWLNRTTANGGVRCDLMRTTTFELKRPKIKIQSGPTVRLPGLPVLEDPGQQENDGGATVIDVCQ